VRRPLLLNCGWWLIRDVCRAKASLRAEDSRIILLRDRSRVRNNVSILSSCFRDLRHFCRILYSFYWTVLPNRILLRFTHYAASRPKHARCGSNCGTHSPSLAPLAPFDDRRLCLEVQASDLIGILLTPISSLLRRSFSALSFPPTQCIKAIKMA
jgi:hypothetical protein